MDHTRRPGLALVALLLASVLLIESCSGAVARSSAPGSSSAPASEPAASGSGIPRWVWLTVAGVAVAAGILAIALVAATNEAAEDAGECAPNCDRRSGGGLLPVGAGG